MFQHLDQHQDGNYLRRMAAVGLMTPNIAHDVNNMLQSVASVLRTIDRRVARGSQDELSILTADGLRAIDRATRLSRRLLTFGRPTSSTRSRVGVNGLLYDLEPLLRWALGAEIALKMSLAEDKLETWCDPQDLENAVMNLAINARDAMPDGGRLTLETFRAELAFDLPDLPRGGYVLIAVNDTGHGMAPEVIAQAFDPFFTTKAAGDGFGMGLASLKAFVTAAGGGTDIVSIPGRGTTVRLYLPLASAAP